MAGLLSGLRIIDMTTMDDAHATLRDARASQISGRTLSKSSRRKAIRYCQLAVSLGVDAAMMSAMKPATRQNTPVTDNLLSYVDYRFPPDVISHAVWLYYRFPLSLRMVEELLAARGIELTYETVRRWSVKFRKLRY